MNKTFDVYNVIMVKVDEKDLMSFLLKNDIDDNAQSKYPLDLLTEEIMSVIPEYAYADYKGSRIGQTNAYKKLKEAANAIYKIKEFDLMYKAYCSMDVEERKRAKIELEKMPFRNRGEFGEIILHFLLRDFKNTIPLVSKVYFKDSSLILLSRLPLNTNHIGYFFAIKIIRYTLILNFLKNWRMGIGYHWRKYFSSKGEIICLI